MSGLYEDIKVAAGKIGDKLEALLKNKDVKKIILLDDRGQELSSFTISKGMKIAANVAAITALIGFVVLKKNYTIRVIRKDGRSAGDHGE